LLRSVDCTNNQITDLNLGNNAVITTVRSSNNLLTEFDATPHGNLQTLLIGGNFIPEINFTSNTVLRNLSVSSNLITSLDFTNNTQLRELYVSNNAINTLDLNNLGELRKLVCINTGISSLNTSQNPLLRDLRCFDNTITSLDLSLNPILYLLQAQNNSLQSIDLRNGNNTLISGGNNFNTTGNINLSCIYVDNVTYSNTNWTNVDSNTIFVETEAECATLSISENNSDLAVSMYPNPANAAFSIGTDFQYDEIKIRDIFGKQVQSSMAKELYDISELASGIYFVEIKKQKRSIVKKLIVN